MLKVAKRQIKTVKPENLDSYLASTYKDNIFQVTACIFTPGDRIFADRYEIVIVPKSA